MRTGRPKVALIVTEDERRRLDSLAHRSRSAPHVARRARIILACAEGADSKVVARRLHVTPATVCKWRGRFVRQRLDGLFDEPRPGAPRTITDEQVEQVIIRTLETTPRGATHWSVRDMAHAVGLSRMAISRIWHTFGLQPHRSETFKLSNDPLLIEKIRDIVGLYRNPPAHAAVFCVDEKPQIQALDRTQPLLPMQPGQVERRTHDYKRHGTTTLFAALNAKTSEVITQFHQRHRSAQFREFLDLIDAQVPRTLDVHIIMDNYSTHKTSLIRNWFAKRPRFHVHFTPTYASWLSLVERWFALLTTKQIRRGVFRSVPQLKAAIQAFIDAHQENPKPFVWTKTADEILASIARFAERTTDARAVQLLSRTIGTGHYVVAESLKSVASIRSRLAALKASLGELPISELERVDPIEDFKRSYGETKSTASVNRTLAILRHAINWGRGRTPPIFTTSPFHRFGVKIKTKGETKRDRRIAHDEEQRLLAAAEKLNCAEHAYAGAPMRDRIIGALETGSRLGEMLKIQNRHVFWNTHQISIPAEHAKDAESRRIPFEQRGRLAQLPKRRRFLGPNAYAFGGPDGEYQGTIRTAWESLVLLAHGIEPTRTRRRERVNREKLVGIDLHWHDLRHAAACRWLSRGLDLRAIQLLLGHARISRRRNGI